MTYFGYGGFFALPHWYGEDATDLVNLAPDVIRSLLDTAGVALLVLALATVLKARRGPAGELNPRHVERPVRNDHDM